MTKPSLPWLARAARDLASCRRGGIGTMGIFLVIPVIAAVGLGVDLARLWLVKSRLQTSVDAAALVAGKGINTAAGTVDGTALFWSNFGRTPPSGVTDPTKKGNTGYLGAIATDPTFTTVSADTILIKASATLERTLLGVVGKSLGTVSAQASVKRAAFGMEVALVLDVTGSMGPNVSSDNGPTVTTSNIAGLRTAATNLLDILYGASDTQPNLFVSVTQFTASVNIGKTNTGWLVPGSLDQNKYGNVKWAGCVEARTGPSPYNSGEDQTDTPPSSQPFTPYLWQSTMDKYKSGKTVVAGDNDWYYNYVGLNLALLGKTKITEQQQATMADGNNAVGPNLACPSNAILPLTISRKTVQASIDAIVAVNRGGTTGNLGLQAGWWTVSPRWAGVWSGTPTTGLPNGAKNLPLPYTTPFMQKVVVFMTDGNNNWYDWPGGAPGDPGGYDGQVTDADYTAYGRLSENRLRVANNNINTAKLELDSRSTALCTKMKAAGIIIYTVILGSVDSATQTLWQNCASKPENYFNSPDKAALAKSFQQIGSQLASLRLTQ